MNSEILSSIFGSLSMILWLFVFIPQIYINYQNKSSKALSIYLLLYFIIGNYFSKLSATYKDINSIIIFMANFHILLNFLIILQILYYRYNEILDTLILQDLRYHSLLSKNEIIFLLIHFSILFISTLFIYNFSNKSLIANIYAWIASFIFFIARLPQILLNYKRKTTDGLSLYSFILMFFANICFFISIIIPIFYLPKNKHYDFFITHIQWILGLSFSSIFDFIIFLQFYIYK